jgi:predicted ATPase/transcriptional regulator with XRE-family HTH domain
MGGPLDDSNTFGVLLRRRREEAGLSQEELAEHAGLTGKAVGALERGDRRHPYPATVRQLADALGLSPEDRTALLATLPARGKAIGRTAADVTTGVPALSTVEAAGSTPLSDLPAPLTLLIGREADIASATHLICEGTRLLTLTGPGGVGKTRLALQLATETSTLFADGVVFVPLAPLADASLVCPTIAHVLGLRESGGQPLLDMLRRSLGGRQLLLLLDNCEHVLPGLTEISPLLEGCPRLVVLATSRSPLRIRGEHEFGVAPLDLPEVEYALTVEEAARSPAVRLFVARARAASTGFELTEENASTVAAICARLDGLPLALELAAPRVKLLPPGALLARLHEALSLLTDGPRDSPARQQTLRNTIIWSHSLLDEAERALFRRLSVFAGGCSLDGVEAVCTAPDTSDGDVLTGLGSLVDKSLLQMRAIAGEPRFMMLETIREFARGELLASGEEGTIREAHARYMVALVEEIEPRLWGPDQVSWINWLVAEEDNVRAALRWLLDAGEIEAVGRLLRPLGYFWWVQGRMVEARQWSEEVLALGTNIPASVRARACLVLGHVLAEQDDAAALAALTEARTLARAMGERWVEGISLILEGFLAPLRNDISGGIDLMWQGQRVLGEAGEEWGVGLSLTGLSCLAVLRGELDEAERYAREHVVLARRMGDLRGIAQAHDDLAVAALMSQDLDRTACILQESIPLCLEVGQTELVASGLVSLAVVAARDQPVRAARYFGAAEALRESIGVAIWPVRRALYDHALDTVRAALDAEAFDVAWAEGRAMTIEQAVGYALGRDPAPSATP